MLRWERTFFVDDDITNVATDDLRATTAMLGYPSARNDGYRLPR